MIGQVIDERFEIRAEIGRGPTGVVYEAHHRVLHSTVALKLFHREICPPAFIPRFFREARSASRLGHESLVSVFDAGTHDDVPYLVTERLSGCDLAVLAEREPRMSVTRVADLLRGPADALDIAHAQGSLHRNLKPRNLFLHRRENGTEVVKILDFGVATFVRERSAADRLSLPGAFLSDTPYLPPETVDSTPLDHRADVYALGVIAFELLAGRPPFTGSSPLAVMCEKVAVVAPTLAAFGLKVRPAVEHALARSLERHPIRRQASCGALAHELRRADRAVGGASTPMPIRPLSRTPSEAPGADGIRLLLVDDDPHFGALLAAELGERGMKLHVTTTLASGERALTSGRYDALIVDGLLPDGSGVEFLERTAPLRQGLPVLFVSGFWRDASSHELLEQDLGVDVVLHKPIEPAHLAEHVDGVLGLDRARAERSKALEMELEQLRAQYLDHLVPRLDQLRQTVLDGAEASDEGAQGTALGEAAELAHQIRGTAGSYALPGISERAGRVQALLDGLLEGTARLTAPQTQELLAIIGGAMEEARGQGATVIEDVARAPTETARVVLRGGDLRFRAELTERAATVGLHIVTEAEAASQEVDGALLVEPDDHNELIAAVSELRRSAQLPQLPIALLSDEPGPLEERLHALTAGVSVVVAKNAPHAALMELALRFRALHRIDAPRVLMVGDDDDLVQQVRVWLKQYGTHVIGLTDPAALLEQLDRQEPDVVILDLVMPNVSGVDLCRLIRATPRWSSLPVIFLTANDKPAARMACYWAGADDVMAKPVIPEELHARVGARLARAALDSTRRELDQLTGLPARATVEGRAAELLSSASRNGVPVCCAVLDVDDLRTVNTEEGHATGDALLSRLGRLLSHRLRAEDLAGRWVGDSFLILSPELRPAAFLAVLEGLRSAFAATEVPGRSGPISRTFSAGWAYAPIEGDDVEALIQLAESRLASARAAPDGLYRAD